MAKQLSTITNEKLFFAQLHLDFLKQQKNQLAVAHINLQQAYLHSTVFHLWGSLHALIHEIAEQYKLAISNNTDCVTLISHYQTLIFQQSQGSIVSPEFNEIKNNIESNSSWLNQLYSAYQLYWQLSAPTVQLPHKLESNAMIATTKQSSFFSLQDCQGWADQLTQLIERLRNGMQEW